MWTDLCPSECPRADDPVTPGVDEIQVIDCQCVGCSGSFTLSYQGQSTRAIPWDATAEFVKYRLLVSEPRGAGRRGRGGEGFLPNSEG